MKTFELEQLLSQILEDHGPALRLYAATWADWPDDCIQQALIKFASCNPKPANHLAWMYKVVRNEAISQQRGRKRRKQREQLVAQRAQLFESQSKLEIESQILTDALSQLKTETREIVVAKIWSGLTFEQIAENAGCSTSAAHRRYQAGLEQLKLLLKNDPNVTIR